VRDARYRASRSGPWKGPQLRRPSATSDAGMPNTRRASIAHPPGRSVGALAPFPEHVYIGLQRYWIARRLLDWPYASTSPVTQARRHPAIGPIDGDLGHNSGQLLGWPSGCTRSRGSGPLGTSGPGVVHGAKWRRWRSGRCAGHAVISFGLMEAHHRQVRGNPSGVRPGGEEGLTLQKLRLAGAGPGAC